MAKLPLSTTLKYGIGGLGINLCDMVFLQWIFVRYTKSQDGDLGAALLSGKWLGIAYFAARIGEGIYNIWIGHWSDSHRGPHGRRIPFVRWGLVPLAALFFLMFMPPPGLPAWGYFIYIFVVLNLYLFLYGVVVTPYLALLPELTPDLHQRVNLTTIQSVFIVVSLIVFSLTGQIIEVAGWLGMAMLVVVLTIGALSPCAFGIKEAPRPPEEKRSNLWQAIVLTMRNRAFLVIAISTAFFWFSLNMIMLLMPFWVMDTLGRPEGDVTKVMAPYLAINVGAFFLFNGLNKKVGKFALFIFTLLGSGVAFSLFALVGHLPFGSDFVQTLVVACAMGVPVAGFMVLPFALLGDAVDYDEQLTGERREAIFFGLQGVFQKVMLGLSASVFGFMKVLGRHGEEAVDSTTFGLKAAALAAAGTAVIACLVFLLYPLRERDGRLIVKGQEPVS